jgi:hypothetical protein
MLSSCRSAPLKGRQNRGPRCCGILVSVGFWAGGEYRCGVRATVHSEAVVQRVHFLPQSVQAIGDWWFAADETVGLHFCSAKFGAANTAIQTNNSAPRLLLYGPTDSLKPALVLEPEDESQAATWCELLEQCQ